MELEIKDDQNQVTFEELSILEVEDRLAFASSARCDSSAAAEE